VIAYLLWPERFAGRDCHVHIDVSDGPLRGRSTVDWNNRLKLQPNALVIDSIEAGPLLDDVVAEISALA
jgi:purine nucleosidase